MSTVYIGHAIGDEHGKASGGEAGNQNGKELRTQPWYLNTKGWIVLRPKDTVVASKLAYDVKAACNNMNIGYDQKQRSTLFKAASSVGYDCARVTTPCECDCSSLVRVCLWYAGIKVKDFNTSSEVSVLMATGKFDKLTDAKYTEQSKFLKTGDILVTKVKGHTCIVLNDGDGVEPAPKPEPPEPTPATDAYVKVLGSVNVRDIPTKTMSNIIYTAHKGDMLPYLGKSEIDNRGCVWYYVKTPVGNGYISAFTNDEKKYTELIVTY